VAAGTGIHVETIAHWLAMLACVWFALASAWGIFGLIGAGHTGIGMAGTAMMSENMLR
jgi:hypothetical protein